MTEACILMRMDESSLWYMLYRRYNIAFRSDCDITVGMELLRSKIHEKLSAYHALKCGFSLKDYYETRPFDYAYITFKTIGPLNIPKEHQADGMYESLNEVWFTFYESSEQKIKLQYFIQLTHGSIIEGISWTKADHTLTIRNSDFSKVKDLFETKIAVQPLSTYTKSSYGVYDGHRHLIGKMFNYEVKLGESGLVMSEKVAETMASRVSRAYQTFISEEFQEIISKAMEKTTRTNHKLKKIKTT